MRILGRCFAGVMCVLLASCGSGSNSKDLLLGKWKETGKTPAITMDFTNEGKVTLEGVGVSMPGTYKWLDNDRVETELTVRTGNTIREKSKVRVTKETLTLTNEQGSTRDFTRAQ